MISRRAEAQVERQVHRDLVNCHIHEDWRTAPQDRSEWRSKVWTCTSQLNKAKEASEKHCKDELKHHREARQTTYVTLVFSVMQMVVDSLLVGVGVWVWVWVCMCVWGFVDACMHAYMHVCMHACMHVCVSFYYVHVSLSYQGE